MVEGQVGGGLAKKKLRESSCVDECLVDAYRRSNSVSSKLEV